MTTDQAPAITLKSAVFRAQRQANWQALEDLIARAERGGVKRLSAEELARLPLLYRAALPFVARLMARGGSFVHDIGTDP